MSRPAGKHPLTFRWPYWTAGALSLLYAICELAGLRECTAALTGVALPSIAELLAGMIYLIAHLAFVLLAPVLILAAGGVLALRWILDRRTPARMA